MAAKRSADHIDTSVPHHRKPRAKRTRISSDGDEADSSAPSSGSVSEDSALRSTPPASRQAHRSSTSSLQSIHQKEEASESSVSSSDSSTDESAREEDEIITIGRPAKPEMVRVGCMERAEDLKSRLETLLPQLATANELLASRWGVSMEDVGEEEDHIEMNLGLGVLEERMDFVDSDTGKDTSEGEEEDYQDNDLPATSSPVLQKPQHLESTIMDDLLRRRANRQRVGIRVMD